MNLDSGQEEIVREQELEAWETKVTKQPRYQYHRRLTSLYPRQPQLAPIVSASNGFQTSYVGCERS